MELNYYVPERVVLLGKRKEPDNCATEVTGLQQTIWVNRQDRLEVKCLISTANKDMKVSCLHTICISGDTTLSVVVKEDILHVMYSLQCTPCILIFLFENERKSLVN